MNKFGESMPLAMSSPITAKDPFGKPDKPGAPEPTGKQTYCQTVGTADKFLLVQNPYLQTGS